MSKVIIIAEAGVNHNGDIEMARKLIDVASQAGADYVKFQTFKAENLVSKEARQAEYQKRNIGAEESQFDMLKRLELKYEDHVILKEYSEKKGIKFLSTGFDDESLDFLNRLGMDFFKIPSGEAVNYLYLKKIASFGLPIVLSTGMCTMEEVEWSYNTLVKEGAVKENITVLHCNTQYPTPYADVNLTAMLTISEKLQTLVGYSDHTPGIEISLAAVAMGASIIEKHFTLDKNLPGPDHNASLDPNELRQLVTAIRNIEIALGDGIKKRTSSEEQNIIPARKSIFAKNDMEKGHVISLSDLTVKRPGDGISSREVENLVGKKLLRAVSKDQKLVKTDFE